MRLESYSTKPGILVLPTVIVLVVVSIFPLFFILYQSFFSYNLTMPWATKFTGGQNYLQVLRSPGFWNSIRVSMDYLIRALLIQLALSLGIALLLNREFWGHGLVKVILASPLVLAPAVVAIVWRLMFNPQTSLINYLMSLVGLSSPTWLGDSSIALWSLVIVDTWQWTPFGWLIMLAGLTALPREVYEAAWVDGASAFKAFRYITLPLLSSKILLVTLFRGLLLLKDFDKIFILTSGGPAEATETLSLLTYFSAFWWFDIGYASTLSVFYLILVIAATAILYRRVKL